MNPMKTIRIEKITLNVGAGKDQTRLEKGVLLLKNITGIEPVKTFTNKRIPTWGLRPGLPIGCKVTLRKKKAENFLKDALVAKGNAINAKSFDNQGNFTLGMNEQALFPEISFQSGAIGSKIRGLGISIVTTAKSREEGKRMLELLGMPFKKEVSR